MAYVSGHVLFLGRESERNFFRAIRDFHGMGLCVYVGVSIVHVHAELMYFCPSALKAPVPPVVSTCGASQGRLTFLFGACETNVSECLVVWWFKVTTMAHVRNRRVGFVNVKSSADRWSWWRRDNRSPVELLFCDDNEISVTLRDRTHIIGILGIAAHKAKVSRCFIRASHGPEPAVVTALLFFPG